MLKDILSFGGATLVNGKMVSYKSGYQVAVNSTEQVFPNLTQVIRYIKQQGLKSVGLWKDGGAWYLDTNTKRFATKKEAVQVGISQNQIAIWDWKKKDSVYL